jgi:hypothetical protein
LELSQGVHYTGAVHYQAIGPPPYAQPRFWGRKRPGAGIYATGVILHCSGPGDIQHTELRASHCKPAEALIDFTPRKLNVVPSRLL